MAKTGQVRYYLDNSDYNYPEGLNYRALVSGSWLDESARLTDISIEGPQGLGFFINNTPTPVRLWRHSGDPSDGAAQWSLTASDIGNASPVYNIKFEAKSLREFININTQRQNEGGYGGSHKLLVINYTQAD